MNLPTVSIPDSIGLTTISPHPTTLTATSVAYHGVGVTEPAVVIPVHFSGNPSAQWCNETFGEVGNSVGTGYIVDSPALAITGELHAVGAYLFYVENTDSVPHAVSIFSICLKTSPTITLQLWSYREMATDNTHIAAGSTGTVSWHCASAVPVFAAYRVYKGSGFSDDADPGMYQIEASKPIAHGWQVTVHAISSDVTAYADGDCDTRRLLLDSIPSQSTTLGPGRTNTVSVACPSSGVLLSRGFEAPDGQDVIMTENASGAVTDPQSSPISAWHVTGVNTGQVSHTLRAYALCGRVAAADLATPTPFTTVTPSAMPSAIPSATP